MAEIDHIIDQLRRRRQEVDNDIGERTSSGGRTDEILRKLEELRRRAEVTDQQR